MTDIKSMYLSELKELMPTLVEKPYRAGQLFSWLHEKRVQDYDEMTNIPSSLRQRLADKYPISGLREVSRLVSKKDGTRKYLFALNDGNVIESVLMKYRHGYSVCISSQAGCSMGCAFCASTIGGKLRDLTASEMLSQVYEIQRTAPGRVSNVVVMGTGEPLDNYENLVRFIRLISDENGMNLSARSITVSTCGLAGEMRRLADEALPVTLAVSLHAPNDRIRRRIMPVANRYAIDDVINAAKEYYEKTGRRVTFEYALVHGINDSGDNAEELAGRLKGFACHVNLIPVNPVPERGFAPPPHEQTVKFENKLEKNRINVTIRREMGGDINGACGQLRKSHIDRADPVPPG